MLYTLILPKTASAGLIEMLTSYVNSRFKGHSFDIKPSQHETEILIIGGQSNYLLNNYLKRSITNFWGNLMAYKNGVDYDYE